MNVDHRARLTARMLAAVLGLALLGGCASLGGNVKGSFACAAPDGICAPSVVIDDRALAMITDDPSAGPVPAGPYRQDRGSTSTARTASVEAIRPALSADVSRTRERVIRIVFPAYIDERGRLHEASAVHAVVEASEWQSAQAPAAPSPVRNAVAAAPQMQDLVAAVEKGGETANPPLAVDPALPSPAAVAAARAVRPDPLGDIKADVAQRVSATKRQPRQAHRPGRLTTVSPVKASVDAASAAAALAAVPATQGAAAAPHLPAPAPTPGPTIQAAGFPAAIPEDD